MCVCVCLFLHKMTTFKLEAFSINVLIKSKPNKIIANQLNFL